MKKKCVVLLVLLESLIATNIALAADIQCPQAKVQTGNGQTVVLSEYVFDNGTHDLVIIVGNEIANVKRITYSSKAITGSCLYKAVAIAKGGDWGWHLAWTLNGKPGIYYSRVDGEAWVSIPARRINDESSDQLRFEVKHAQVILRGYSNQGNTENVRLISEDEGRNW